MSTVTKAISSVEFHVNARQANAALQSMQEEAKKCSEEIDRLQKEAAKGVKMTVVDGQQIDIEKRISQVKSLQKTWKEAIQSQIKGAKAFDELWKNARMGTIESMTGAQIKSGINASKPIYDRLRLGDAEDRMKAQAIKDMQDQGQKVLNQLKTTTDQIIKQIADGETIAADVLEREARNLKSIMDLLPPLSQEWKDYNLQYQAINQQIERQTVLERQLRGEIVTREDAIRVINAANREATQQEIAQEEQRAKAAREAAEAKASEADQYRTTVEQKQSEIFATNDLIAAKRREIDAHHESAAAAKDAADKAREAAYKDRKQAEQEARNQQDAYNKQKKIRDDAAKDVEKFRKELEKMGPVEQKEAQNTEELTRLQEAYNQKVERRKQLEQELDAIKARSLEDDPHVKQLREEISTLDELIAVSDKYRNQFAKMSDTAFEKGYMGKTDLEDERTSVFRAEDYLKRAYRDKMKAGVADMNPDDPEYQDAAKRVAGGIVQNAQENLRRAIFNEIKGGELSSKALEEKIETYRNMMGQAAREAYSLKDDPEYNTYKYIIAQMEKYLDVARQVEAERQKIAGNEPFMKATQSDVLNDVFGDSLIRQRDKRMFDELTAGRPFREKQEQDEATAKRELKKAQDEESESLGRLNKAKKESTEQTAASNEQDEKRAGVQQKLTDAETRLADENRKLNEQADKTITANQQATQAVNTHQQSVKALGDVMEENRKTGQRLGEEMGELTKQHKQQTEELAEASEKMTDAEKESNRHIKAEQEARLRIQQINNQSIEQLTASLRVLEEENRRINDPGNQRWQENERYIGQLNLRLEELKKQSAELRREPVLDMMTQRMDQLSTLSADALQETKKFWEAQRDGAKNFSEEYTKAKEALELLAKEERQRVIDRGESAFDFFQREDYRRTNAADTEEQRKALVAYRDALPADATDHIEAINALLEKQAQFVKEAAGEWMSLEKAMELASKAGTDQFAGSAKDIQLATQSLERQRDTIIATIREKRNLGQATKAEEDQLADLTKKLRSLKFEQDNVNMSQEKMRTLIETPANAVNLDELRAAIKRADGQLRQMEQSLGQNSDEYKRFAEQVRNAKNVMKEMEGQAKASATAWEKAFSRLKTYVVMYMGFNEVWQKVSNTARDLMDLSDRMGEVRKTTGFTADEVGRLSENLKKMDVRTSLTSLMEISASAGQLGLKTLEDVQGFTEAANKLMIALPEMGREAATEMMRVAIATGEVDKIRKQLQEGTIEGSSATAVAMEKIASTIDRLRATSASTAPEITDFVKRVGAVGAQSGITIDQVAALGSTVSSLGMRIEMSATALSRMIPAIRNNAFELAKAIGVTPDYIRQLFDAGRGMEVILMILQRIKETNMNADDIDNMLGMSGMRDIMKDLNQQGARAGIVFSGLSQNVDELRRQLGVANQAYEENIAIQQEFNRMNETTAAKWERLKNQIEELFVGDQAQRYLGSLIDVLRGLVDLLTGPLKGSILILGTLIGLLKIGLGAGLVTAVIKVIDVFKNWRIAIELTTMKLHAMKAAQWGNLFTAIAGAVLMLVLHFRQLGSVMTGVAKAIATLEAELRKEVKAVNELFHAVAKSNVELENKRKKLEEVKKAGKEATDAENQLKKANAEHAATIREINSKYGQYLGYMLSETSSAQQLAKARELINAKLRETITLKQREAALGNIEQEYGGKVNKRAASTEQEINELFGDNYDVAARVSVAISEAAEKYAKDARGFRTAVDKIISANSQFFSEDKKNALRNTYRMSNTRFSESDIVSGVASSLRSAAEGYREATEEYMKQEDAVNNRFEARTNNARKNSREKAVGALNAILGDWKKLVDDYQKAEGEEKERLAAEVYKQQRSYANAVANNAEYFENDNRKAVFDKNINNMKTYEKGLRSVAGEAIRTIDAMERAESKVTGIDYTNSGESGNNPWGGKPDAESTDWKNMTAEQLVNRRKQMKDFVNAIQTDTDVQSVLKEDAALKKAIEAGMSSDMRTVIEWYNAERLKIQDELHARHLTNTGDWLDPKKERGAKKQFRDEMDAYLHELDAYYTERKTRIEQARNDEEITEGEAWRRTIQNDNEWQTRRAELQKLYSRKQKEVTQEELDAIIRIIAERTGDSEAFVKAAIAKTNQFVDAIEKSGDKGAAIVHRWMSQVVLDTERSYLKAAQAIGKQMKFIEETLAKERPYDGITKNLQDNLDKMGVLAAKYRRENEELARQDKEPKYSNEQITAQSYDEMAFYLRQAADAYSIDIDELLRRMVKEGMTATAEEISKSDMLKQAVMGQLRKTYQEVQDAVKKEASQIKKDVEIIWNDDARGIGGMSMKATFDKALAQLGMQQDSVSRANSLIGAGAASDNVASRLAMKQIEVQMRMQKAQYDMYRVQANQRMAALKAEAEEHRRLAKQMEKENHLAESKRELLMATNAERDAENVRLSLGLTLAEETKKEEQQKAELLKIQEESQNRLYTSLREWADLLTSSLQGVMEASHAGDAEYYNERAKLNLTGKGGPGAGTYVVIDDAGTSDAKAHYEYLDERQALERQHEIEVQNAQAEAWRKLMDDLNAKMSEQITDWMNAYLQNKATEDNTDELQRLQQKLEAEQQKMDASVTATDANTQAVQGLTQQLAEGITVKQDGTQPDATGGNAPGTDDVSDFAYGKQNYAGGGELSPAAQQQINEQNAVTENFISNKQKEVTTETQTDKKIASTNASTFAKMTMAANLYGIAYQAMSNDNLSTTQKFQMMAVQAAGNAAISMLTTEMASASAKAATDTPGVLGTLWKQLGWAAAPVFAIFTGLLGGLMGLATSKIGKAKSEIAQATGASVGAGRLATGMKTYAEGNVNELTDPASLTPGRQYNVDGADGKTYRARYMGKGAKTHITNGAEFHLVGEAGREAIIDAKTTRLLQMNETGIWRDIQTLYNGGSISGLSTRRRRGGVRAYAEGNIGEFEDALGGEASSTVAGGMGMEQMLTALDRNRAIQEALLERLNQPIYAQNILYGSEGLPNVISKLQKEAKRHGVKYL